MPWNLLILPLLGGFLFVETFVATRVGIRRNPPQRLLLYSAHAGVWLLVCALLLDFIFRSLCPDLYMTVVTTFHEIAPIPHAGKSFGALMLGLLLPRVLNCLYGSFPERSGLFIDRLRGSIPENARLQAGEDLVKRRNDPLEQFLFNAVNEKYSMFTLSSGKVYVGILLSEPNMSHGLDSIKIAPWESGYRTETLEYCKTTDYSELYPRIDVAAIVESRIKDLPEESQGKASREEIREEVEREYREEYRDRIESIPLIIPLREIASVRRFDPEVYHRHFA